MEPRLLTSRSASTATYSRRKRAAAGQSARPSFSPRRARSIGPTPRSAARMSRSRSWPANARVRRAGRRSVGQPTGSSSGSSPTTSSSSRMIRSCSGPVSSRGDGSPRSAAARRSNPKAYAGKVRTSGSRSTRWPSCAIRASMRCRSAVAPRRPKVSTRIRSGSTPSATRAATASTSVLVLPVPGPPSTSIGPSVCPTTSACTGSARQPPPTASSGPATPSGPPDAPTPPPDVPPLASTEALSGVVPSPRAGPPGRRTNRYACISSSHQTHTTPTHPNPTRPTPRPPHPIHSRRS
ncbi:DNA-directed RNA polymerase [Micromonospora saelicesensis]|uniref:DNA-directed RNA polymerase n=1 Tax=Micromonospora saelicesensis TaxID=285676 RepID=A0ABX9CFS7_9ACTN|nr:DNA-directed RNA polymerase [Micromonospora saelicesensis]